MRRRRSLREEIVIASRAVILALIIWRTRRDRGKVTHRPRDRRGETQAGMAGEGNVLTAWGGLRPGPGGPRPAEPPASTGDTEMRRLGLRNRPAAGGNYPPAVLRRGAKKPAGLAPTATTTTTPGRRSRGTQGTGPRRFGWRWCRAGSTAGGSGYRTAVWGA